MELYLVLTLKARLDLVGQFFPLQGGLNARNNFIRNYGCGPKIVTFAYEKGPKDKNVPGLGILGVRVWLGRG